MTYSNASDIWVYCSGRAHCSQTTSERRDGTGNTSDLSCADWSKVIETRHGAWPRNCVVVSVGIDSNQTHQIISDKLCVTAPHSTCRRIPPTPHSATRPPTPIPRRELTWRFPCFPFPPPLLLTNNSSLPRPPYHNPTLNPQFPQTLRLYSRIPYNI